ncbi:MAG: TetR/AcrR family transcriptional regulator [Nitrospirae bacterium]|nr:TetR/AcrR family transcriptional regulator [Nitrospirota bacterium]
MQANSKHLRADERRAVTVEAVVELAAEQNPNDITTAAIAKRMNLTQGAIFRHFPSKDSIWQAVMEWVAARLSARTEKAVQAAASPLAALEAMFMTHIDFVVRHPGVPRILFGELQHAEDTPARRIVQTLLIRYGERLGILIEKGKSQGELSQDVDTMAAVSLFIGMLQGLVMQSLLTGDFHRMRAEAPGVFAIFSRGIGGI